MHGMNMRDLDLNLLVALDALLETRHVTRASRELGLSQSATSHALARLREAMGDELLVRGAGGLVPTARAEALREPLRAALRAVEDAIEAPEPFDPATASRTFTVVAGDYVQLVLLPPLLARLAREAPGIDLRVAPAAPDEPDPRLAGGQIDMVLSVPRRGFDAAGIRARHLFDERFVCLVREDHPRVGATLTMDDYLTLPHALVAPGGRPGGIVDTALAAMGKTRRIAVAVPHFLVVPHAIVGSDLVVTLAARAAAAFCRMLPLRVLEPPLELPDFSMTMYWHERAHRDPGHQWLRGVLVAISEEVSASAPSSRSLVRDSGPAAESS